MKLYTRAITAAMIGAALLGVAGSGVANAAPTAAAASASATQDYHRGFYIQNLSKHTLTLTDIINEGQRDLHPDVGTTIAPGQTFKYDKVWWVFKDRETTLRFQWSPAVNQIAAMEVTMHIDMLGATKIFPDDTSRSDIAVSIGGLGSIGGNANTVVVAEHDASTVTVPAGEAQKQADILSKTCVSDLAVCTFTPTSRTAGTELRTPVAQGWNNMPTPMTVSFTTKAVATVSQTLELTANATYGVKDVFSVGMSAKYGQTWTASKEESLTHTVTVPAHTFYQKVAVIEREKVTGDFTVKLGKTTWKLNDVAFQIPLSSTPIGYKELPRPLTDAERAELPTETKVTPVS